MTDSWLSGFSSMLDRQTEERQERIRKFNAVVPEPLVFIPDEGGAEGHGIGWFQADGGFIAFRKYSNGYHPERVDVLTNELVKKLAEHLPK